MPLPTSLPETPADTFQRVISTASSVASNLRGVRNLLQSGPVQMDNLIGLYQALNGAQAAGVALQGAEGLGDYAKEVLGDPSYDVFAAFGASIAACRAVTDWLLANMPSDGHGGYIGWRQANDGSIQRITVPLDSVAPLKPLIDAALATFG